MKSRKPRSSESCVSGWRRIRAFLSHTLIADRGVWSDGRLLIARRLVLRNQCTRHRQPADTVLVIELESEFLCVVVDVVDAFQH